MTAELVVIVKTIPIFKIFAFPNANQGSKHYSGYINLHSQHLKNAQAFGNWWNQFPTKQFSTEELLHLAAVLLVLASKCQLVIFRRYTFKKRKRRKKRIRRMKRKGRRLRRRKRKKKKKIRRKKKRKMRNKKTRRKKWRPKSRTRRKIKTPHKQSLGGIVG